MLAVSLADLKKKARPPQGGRAVLLRPNLLPEITSVASNSGAKIPSENCEAADVQAAGSELDIVECSRVKHIIVDFRIFGLARSAESSCRVDDSRQRRRCNAGPAYHEPACAENRVTVENPNPGVGVRVKGKVRSAAEISDNGPHDVLEGRAGFHLARAATGVLPGVFEFESSGRAVAGKRRAASRNHVRRCARINNAGTISSRSEINDAGSCEVHVKFRFLSEFPGSETHRDFTATVRSHKPAGQDGSVEQIAKPEVLRFHQKNLGIWSHRMRPLDVQRGLKFRAAAGVWTWTCHRRLRPIREHNRKVCSGQSELRRESSQIGGGAS